MPQRRSEIPAVVYLEFVRSLTKDASTVLTGVLLHAALAVLVWFDTGNDAYLYISGTFLFVGAVRYIITARYTPKSIIDIYSAHAYENTYLVVGSLYGLVLGAFCFLSIYTYPNGFSEIASVSVAMGSTISIVGRNYGSRRLVLVLAASIVAPISIALILKGDVTNVALGFFLLPFLFIIDKMSTHVRNVLDAAATSGARAQNLASRFDRALNTMPNGLIMFGAQGVAVVANAEAASLLSFDSANHVLGRTLKALMFRCVAAKLLSREECYRTYEQLGRALKEGSDSKVLVNFANGRYFEFSARGGEGNLGVITFEEVTERIEAERQIRNMARFDSLTGLPNRTHFREIVERSLASGDVSRMCALAIIDIDDFKQINDTHGHPVGDGLIYEIAMQLRRVAGDSVVVSRFGGDEFLLFFDGISDERELATRFDAIFAMISEPMDVGGHQLRVSASAGATVSLAFAVDIDSMIVKADLALYKVKGKGKDAWLLFAPEMDRAFRERQTLKAELRRAVERGELRAVYQPIIDIKSMRVSTCEALARWTHPDLGEVSPGVFIPLAEDMGIVSQITARMLKVACTECANWPDGIGVSVNLSAVDFQSRNIIDVIAHSLQLSGLEPSRLEIEVTETALLNDQILTRTILEEIKGMGVRIALDDYGTGYSNLTYVHSLPLDKLKIDQSFLSGIEDNPRSLNLLKATVRLAREMGLDVTIEGVETTHHLEVLSDTVKPDYVQGFVFGPPLPASGIPEFRGFNVKTRPDARRNPAPVFAKAVRSR